MAASVKNISRHGIAIRISKCDEATGTGSSQNVAHGLGVTPDVVFLVPSELTGGADDFAEGTHTATNVVATVTSGAKFKALAIAFISGREE